VSGAVLDKQADQATGTTGFSQAIEVGKVSQVNKRSPADARGLKRIHDLPGVRIPRAFLIEFNKYMIFATNLGSLLARSR
jgi:hypothetical protein